MTKFYFGDIEIGELSASSGVYAGRNVRVHVASRRKINEGFGNVTGARAASCGNRAVVNDHDAVDTRIRSSKG